MYKFFIIIFTFFITGCSLKINPDEYNPAPAPKAQILPTKREINFKPNIIIYSKNTDYSYAKNRLSLYLSNSKLVNILDRHDSVKDEIKLAEQAKLNGSNLNQADYILFIKITSTTYNNKYIPPEYYKDKKGKIHKIPGYFKYTGCIDGFIQIYSVIPYEIKKIIYLNDCESTTSSDYQNYRNYIITNAIINSIDAKKDKIFRFFSPKGFIFEIRKNGNYIIHTTLGSKNGAKKEERVYIYTRKKTDFFNTPKIEEIKIGEGIISNIVHENDSWIIVKKLTKPLHIGDYVKMNYKHSFWDIFR